ncbi:ADOP family duplicated permease [Opitutaceae bacterium]|nr:ADOP family duplicated permease [Opitutaceae bacterium]
MSMLISDFHSALRFFSRRRVAFLISVSMMALALGANTAVFSALRAFIFANLGVPEAERTVFLSTTKVLPGRGTVNFFGSYPNYERLRDQTESFSATAAMLTLDLNWDQGDQTTRIQGVRVTNDFLDVFDIEPQLGRKFLAEEQGPGAAPSALISDRLWRTAFHANPTAVGQTLRVNGELITIVGVLPARFEQPFNAQMWLPFDLPERLWTAINGGRGLTLMGRLKDGVSIDEANRELTHFAKVNETVDPANEDWGWIAQSLPENTLAGAGNALLLVQAGAGILLLLAVTNLTSLLLAWSSERARENALRLALGANSWHLIRQYLVQSVVLVSAGGVAGLVLANAVLPLLGYLNPNPSFNTFMEELTLDRTTLGFTGVLILLTALIAGVLPALHARRTNLDAVLREGGRGGGAGPTTLGWQRLLVIVQSAISIVILVIAAMAGLGFKKLTHIDLGFAYDNRATFRIEFPTPSHESHEARAQFVRELELNLAQEPTLTDFGFSSTIPVGDIQWGGGFSPQLPNGTFTEEPHTFHFRRASPTYTRVLGTALLEGRRLSPHDTAESRPVAVISQSAAQKYWPEERAVGRMLRPNNPADAPLVEIVGVVTDVRDAGAGFPAAETVYVPWSQKSVRRGWIVLQGHGSTADLLAAGQRALRRTSPAFAPIDACSLESLVWQSYAIPRLQITLLGVFGAIALLMSVLGTYGVMSQLVNNQRRDLAVRAALGASNQAVLRHVLLTNARLAAIGIIAGLIAAGFIAHTAEAGLTGFNASPLWPYVVGGGLLLITTQVASFIPARRAGQIDIAQTLAGE